MTTTRRLTFRGLFLINFLISLGFAVSDAFFPLYCQSLGGRGLWLGVAVASYALVKIILSPLMGRLSDRHGWQAPVLISLLLFLAVSVLYALTADLLIIVILRILQGAGCALFRPVVQALIASQGPEHQRATLLGRFDSSFYAALCLGTVLGGFIWDRWGFIGLFTSLFSCCLGALVIAIPLALLVPDKLLAPAGRERRAPFPAGDDKFFGLLLFIFGRACGIAACAAFLPIFLISKLNLTGGEVGVIMASSTTAMALLLTPAGKLADKVSRKNLILVGGVTVALFYLLLPLTTGFGTVLLTTLGIGAGSALSQPAASALLAEHGKKTGMGSTLGIFHAALNLGFVFGSLAGAAIQARYGPQTVFCLAGLFGLISLTGLVVPLSHPRITPSKLRSSDRRPAIEAFPSC